MRSDASNVANITVAKGSGDQSPNLTPQQAAKKALLQRSKKASTQSHKQVTYGFLITVAVAILYVVFVPKENSNDMLVIDDTQILVHNG